MLDKPQVVDHRKAEVILGEEDYNCRFGGYLARVNGQVGLMRGNKFFPLSEKGRSFIVESGNPLIEMI